jgi:2-polyprenyl-3-methyl-5-hydroxy-6-metoxy-1,4-benzoquinol methylase
MATSFRAILPTIACRPLDQAVEKSVGNGSRRFEFGENWRRFAEHLPPARIDAAEESLVEMLGRDSLRDKTFLDVGSGSGLFSLSAVRLGAGRVHSLDYDPVSVATTEALKRRFAPDSAWTIERGSVLDRAHMDSLGSWDVVYSWGVLHHTGDLWEAMAITCDRVAAGGSLFISIYNDQGRMSRVWRRVKRIYGALPMALRTPYVILVMAPMELRSLVGRTLRGRPLDYFRRWGAEEGYDRRGMTRWRDLVDWVGGYPFEVASPDEVFDFCAARGLELRKLTTVGGELGCNEFVFERTAPGPDG